MLKPDHSLKTIEKWRHHFFVDKKPPVRIECDKMILTEAKVQHIKPYDFEVDLLQTKKTLQRKKNYLCLFFMTI